MAGKFVLTAEIRLRAPKNLKQVAQQIKSSLGGKTTQVKVETKGTKKAASELARVEKAVEKASSAAARGGGKFDALGKAISQAVVHVARYDVARRIVTGFAQSLGRATKDAIAFEREIIKVSQVTGQSVSSLKFLNVEVTRLATNFGVSSSSLVKTTRILAQAGLTARQTKQALEALAKTTLAPTFDDITSTTETSIAVMSQFGIEASRLESVLGKINKVAGSFAVEAGDLGTAIKRAGGVFKTAGGSVEELIALFTSVRSTTRETAETIATGFRTIFTRLQRPTTLKFLKQFGIQLQTLEGQFVGPYEAIRRLNAVLKDLDPRDIRYSMITEQLGGFRQVSKVIPLIQQFEKAQKAYNVALDGGSSLAQDAQTAQQGLAVQFTKVREEFTALIRAISNDTIFRGMIELATNMARAFIRVADSIKPIIPLLAAFGSFAFARGVGRFALGRGGGGGGRGGGVPGVFGVNKGGRIKKYARGGLVPGSGNADTVPAMLQPGEFVIKKSAVQAHGTSRLSGMNRAARGGRIRYAGGGSVKKKAETFGAVAIRNRVVQHDVHEANVRLGAGELYNAGDEFSTTVKTSKVGIYNDDLQRRTRAGRKAFPVGKNFKNKAGAKADPANFGRGFEKFAIAERTLQDLNKTKANSPLDAKRGTQLFEVKSGKYTKSGILEKRLHHSIALTKRKGKFSSLTSENDPPAKPGVRLSPVTVLTPHFLGPRPKSKRKTPTRPTRKASGGAIGFAAGGSVDTVPALLTPGEFVVNKESSQRIGYSKLNAMNKFARGGPVQKFANGGPVKMRDGGPFPAGGGGPSARTSSVSAVAVNKANKGLEETGKAGKKTGRDLLGMAFVLSAVSESLITTDGVLKDLVATGTQFALTFTLLQTVIASEKMTTAFTNISRKISGDSERVSSSLGMVGAGLIAASFALNSFVNTLVASQIKAGGSRRAGATTTGAIGGGAAGAIGGGGVGLLGAGALAATGAVTVGTGGLALLVIIPALIAAFALGYKGFNDAAQAIQKADFRDSVSKLDDTFQKFSKGKVSAGFALQQVKGRSAELRGVVQRDPSQRGEFAGEIKKLTGKTKELILEFAKTSKTTQEFDDATRGVIREANLLSQTSFRQLREEAHKQIEAQGKAREVQAKLNQSIEDTFKTLNLQRSLAAAFREMTARVQEAGRGLEVFATLASGRLSIGKPRGIGRLLQNPSEIVDLDEFNREIDTVDSKLAEMGANVDKVSAPAKKAGEVLSRLPAVLLGAAKASPLATPGEGLVDIVLDQLGLSGGENKEISRALQLALGGIQGGLAAAIKADPEGINKKVADALTPFLKTHAEGAKFIDASNKQLAAALQQRTQLELKIAQEEGKMHTLRLQSLTILAQARGTDISLAEIKQEEEKRRKKLLGGASGTGVDDLGNKLKSLQNEIVNAELEYERGNISFRQLQDATATLRSQFVRVTLVLKEYADIQKQVAAQQKKLAEFRSVREKKVSTLQDATFGGLDDIIKLAANFRAVGELGEGKQPLRVGDPRNKELLGVLRSFGNVPLKAFGEITRPELEAQGLGDRKIAEALKKRQPRTGDELAAFKTFEFFKKTFPKLFEGGRGGDIERQMLGGVSSPEEALIKAMEKNILRAQAAQAALVDSLKQTNRDLGDVIARQNREFLRGLRQLFIQSEIDKASIEKEVSDQGQKNAQATVKALKEDIPDKLKKVLEFRRDEDRHEKITVKGGAAGILRNLDKDVLRTLQQNLEPLKALNKIRQKNAAQQERLELLKGPVTRADVRETGTGFAFDPTGFKEIKQGIRQSNFGPVSVEGQTFLGEQATSEANRRSGNVLQANLQEFLKVAKQFGFLDALIQASPEISEERSGPLGQQKALFRLLQKNDKEVGKNIGAAIDRALGELGISPEQVPSLTKLIGMLDAGGTSVAVPGGRKSVFPLVQLSKVLDEVKGVLIEKRAVGEKEESDAISDILTTELKQFFESIGVDPALGAQAFARSTEVIQEALKDLDTFDLVKAKDQLRETKIKADLAAGALKGFNEQLAQIKFGKKLDLLIEDLQRDPAGVIRDRVMPFLFPEGIKIPVPAGGAGAAPGDPTTGIQGGFDQFSATRGGADRLRTDDTIAHALLESINRGVNRGGTPSFSARGGVVYASGGTTAFKPRGTDTVPAQTPDGQQYGLTPGERVMSVKATNAFGPQLASMERSAQTGIGFARGGIVYAQGGAPVAPTRGVGPSAPAPQVGKDAPKWMTHKKVSDLSPDLQKTYKAMGYGPKTPLWFGSNQELRGPITKEAQYANKDVLDQTYQMQGGRNATRKFTGHDQLEALTAMMANFQQQTITKKYRFGGAKEFQAMMNRLAPGQAPPPGLLGFMSAFGMGNIKKHKKGGDMRGKNIPISADIEKARKRVYGEGPPNYEGGFMGRFKTQTGIDPARIFKYLRFFDSQGISDDGRRVMLFQNQKPRPLNQPGGRATVEGFMGIGTEGFIGQDASYNIFYHEAMHALNQLAATSDTPESSRWAYVSLEQAQRNIFKQKSEGGGLANSGLIKMLKGYGIDEKSVFSGKGVNIKMLEAIDMAKNDPNQQAGYLTGTPLEKVMPRLFKMTTARLYDQNNDGFLDNFEWTNAIAATQFAQGQFESLYKTGKPASGKEKVDKALRLKKMFGFRATDEASVRKAEGVGFRDGKDEGTVESNLANLVAEINGTIPGFTERLYNYTNHGVPSRDTDADKEAYNKLGGPGFRKEYLANRDERFVRTMMLTSRAEWPDKSRRRPPTGAIPGMSIHDFLFALQRQPGGEAMIDKMTAGDPSLYDRLVSGTSKVLGKQGRITSEPRHPNPIQRQFGGIIYKAGGGPLDGTPNPPPWANREHVLGPKKPTSGDWEIKRWDGKKYWVRHSSDTAKTILPPGPSTTPPGPPGPPKDWDPDPAVPTRPTRPPTPGPGPTTPQPPPQPRPRNRPQQPQRRRRPIRPGPRVGGRRNRSGGIYPHIGIRNPNYYFNMLSEGGTIYGQTGIGVKETRRQPKSRRKAHRDMKVGGFSMGGIYSRLKGNAANPLADPIEHDRLLNKQDKAKKRNEDLYKPPSIWPIVAEDGKTLPLDQKKAEAWRKAMDLPKNYWSLNGKEKAAARHTSYLRHVATRGLGELPGTSLARPGIHPKWAPPRILDRDRWRPVAPNLPRVTPELPPRVAPSVPRPGRQPHHLSVPLLPGTEPSGPAPPRDLPSPSPSPPPVVSPPARPPSPPPVVSPPARPQRDVTPRFPDPKSGGLIFRKARPGEREMGPKTKAREIKEKRENDLRRKQLYQEGLSNQDIIEQLGKEGAARLGIGGRPKASKFELRARASLRRRFKLTEAQIDEALYFGITDEEGNVTFKGSQRPLGPTKAKPKKRTRPMTRREEILRQHFEGLRKTMPNQSMEDVQEKQGVGGRGRDRVRLTPGQARKQQEEASRKREADRKRNRATGGMIGLQKGGGPVKKATQKIDKFAAQTKDRKTGLYYKGRNVVDIIKGGLEARGDDLRGAITGSKDKDILPFLGDVVGGMGREAERHKGNLLDTLGIPRDYAERLGLVRDRTLPPVSDPFDWDKKVEEYRRLDKKRSSGGRIKRPTMKFKQSGGMIGLQRGGRPPNPALGVPRQYKTINGKRVLVPTGEGPSFRTKKGIGKDYMVPGVDVPYLTDDLFRQPPLSEQLKSLKKEPERPDNPDIGKKMIRDKTGKLVPVTRANDPDPDSRRKRRTKPLKKGTRFEWRDGKLVPIGPSFFTPGPDPSKYPVPGVDVPYLTDDIFGQPPLSEQRKALKKPPKRPANPNIGRRGSWKIVDGKRVFVYEDGGRMKPPSRKKPYDPAPRGGRMKPPSRKKRGLSEQERLNELFRKQRRDLDPRPGGLKSGFGEESRKRVPHSKKGEAVLRKQAAEVRRIRIGLYRKGFSNAQIMEHYPDLAKKLDMRKRSVDMQRAADIIRRSPEAVRGGLTEAQIDHMFFTGKSIATLKEEEAEAKKKQQQRQDGGMIKKFHSGGFVQRQGGGDVPARLEGGEFVMQKKAVDNIGLDNMQALNEGGVIYAQDGRSLKERFKGVDPQTGMLRKKDPSIPGQEGMRGQGAFSRKMQTEAYLDTLSGGADTERRAGKAAAIKRMSEPKDRKDFERMGRGEMYDPRGIKGGGKLKFLGTSLGISGDSTRDVIGALKEQMGWPKGEQERLREDPALWEDLLFDFTNLLGVGLASMPVKALKAGKAGVKAAQMTPAATKAATKAFIKFMKNAPIKKSKEGLIELSKHLKSQHKSYQKGADVLKEGVYDYGKSDLQGKTVSLSKLPRVVGGMEQGVKGSRTLLSSALPTGLGGTRKVSGGIGKYIQDSIVIGQEMVAKEVAAKGSGSALKTGAGAVAREGVEKLTISSPGAGLGLTPAEFRGGGWADIADDPNALKNLFSDTGQHFQIGGSSATQEGIEDAIEKGFFTLPEGMSIKQFQAIIAHGSERNIGGLMGSADLKKILRAGKPLSGSALETVNLLDSIRHRIPNKLHSGMDVPRVDAIVSQVGRLDESAIGKTFKVNEYVSGTTNRDVAQSFGFSGRHMKLGDAGPKWTGSAYEELQYSGGLKKFYPDLYPQHAGELGGTPPRVVLDITTKGEGIRIGNAIGHSESESLLRRGSEFEIIGLGPERAEGGGIGRGISLKVRQKQQGGLIPSYHSGGMVRNLAGGGDVLARLQENEFVLKANAASRLKKDFGSDFLNNMNNYHGGGAVQTQAASTSIGGGGGGGEISINMNDFTNALNATLQTFTQGMQQVVGPLAEAGDNLAKVDGSVITMSSKQSVNVNMTGNQKGGSNDAMVALADEAVRQGINQVLTKQGAAPMPSNKSSVTPIGKTQGLA